MNQHPVPQNVTQYQFRLVGDMTLKQFLELAAGIVLAALFYSSNLIFIFKAPLILLSVFFGIALAFFPIEDRPLDQWIINFINSIYRPTRFTWKKTNKIPSIFTFVAHSIAPTNTITKTIKAPVIKPAVEPESDLSEGENSQVNLLNALFGTISNTQASPSVGSNNSEAVVFDKPSITIRKLKPREETHSPPIAPTKSVTIPAQNPAGALPPTKSDITDQDSKVVPDNLVFSASKPDVSRLPTTQAVTKMTPVSLPVSPQSPNLIVGVTTSKDGKLVDGAIVQVIDQSGTPLRAMKTNSLGQFATSTPLLSGTYHIEVEADGHSFPTQQLVINNAVVPPFEIRAIS